MMTETPYAPPTAVYLEADEKLCSTCHATIPKPAEICPKCGVRQEKPANKIVLLLLIFFLGSFGAHRFYFGHYVLGILYLLFFWTWIPPIIALIEFIVFIFISSEKIADTYTAHGSAVAFAFIPLFLIVIGIIAALTISAYNAYLNNSKVIDAMKSLSSLKVEAETYFSNTGQFPSTVELESGGATTSSKYVNISSNPDKLYLQATMNENAGSLVGKIMRLSYDPVLKTWTCSADFQNGIPKQYVPYSCRHNL